MFPKSENEPMRSGRWGNGAGLVKKNFDLRTSEQSWGQNRVFGSILGRFGPLPDHNLSLGGPTKISRYALKKGNWHLIGAKYAQKKNFLGGHKILAEAQKVPILGHFQRENGQK